ncbi:hypothetical protein QTL86_11000 [Cellulosilyticum sp. ST5]|uniref:Uncharacterized protein n=1 Tax=Cellulosilyticum lentocellum (strain ATCC 49066 / DSM 5427 / NCIMB 11756 / RHM5) TaxID=642492 RepID=F2JH99_CELLD|nr:MULTISPECIES: hypothetical protein [Cellulosilyticum]ADZ82997.1 hypothetical protein Clole_1270 [Cellulosilyticum lentocellum DSM 5427]QEH68507.1 hypothetical protein EKH84_09020 [Cellulosilyticum sp. WCF-2]
MKETQLLYKKFHTREKYKDIDEIKILTALYQYSVDSLEAVVSRIINEAVLGHMNLNLDSTIMQMLALNDYLSSLFIRNFEALIYNYLINYLEKQGIEEIDETLEEKLDELVKSVDMKTNLEELLAALDELCMVNH